MLELTAVGLLCSLHLAQASLPSLAEVRARTRWCLAEGAHCHLNLLQVFNFSSCCAPYICTAIPNTHKPSWLPLLTEHRCLLPSAQITNSTVESDRTEFIAHGGASIEQNVDIINKTTQGSSNNTQEYSSEAESANLDERISDESRNSSSESQSAYYSEEKQLKRIVKRNTKPEFSNSEDISVNITPIGKNESLQSSNNASSDVSENSPEDLTQSSSISENFTQNYDEYETNQTASRDYELSRDNSSELLLSASDEGASNVTLINSAVDASNMTLTNSVVEAGNNVTLANATDVATSSEVFSGEDWHSSQMRYDTRPMLQKVVRVPPFHLFNDVKVTRINESIETSAD